MLLKTKGNPNLIKSPIVGRVTFDSKEITSDSIFLNENNLHFENANSAKAILSKEKIEIQMPSVSNVQTFEHLSEGDVVSIGLDGVINTLYRVNSNHNTILATERCNSNCLMCSQPPRDKNDIPRLYEIYKEAIPLFPKDCIEIGISGGEPTLMGEYFFKTLENLSLNLPDSEIHILTNGRSFAWNSMIDRLNKVNTRKMMFGIPVYSDYYQTHDHIVQAKDAFNQTILGLHNLARYNHRIEIRIVLHKLSIPRLTKLSRYIFKNLPFVEHIAFMGLEYIGYTPFNIDKLWIDPKDYVEELSESVEFLANQGMHTSIYNSQLCVMPENLWKYCRKSISDWKNDYLKECQNCSKLNECGGLFTWNLNKHSEHIKPIIN